MTPTARDVPLPVTDPTCCRLGCENPAAWQPILVLCHPNGKDTCEAILRLGVCEACKPQLVAEDFVCDEGWAQIVAGMLAANAAPPDRAKTKLDWRRISAEA